MCRVLRVHRSGFYAWLREPESTRAREDARLLELIRSSSTASDMTYGSPRIHRDLREAGEFCGERRAARIMRQNGIEARFCRKRPRFRAGRPAAAAPNRSPAVLPGLCRTLLRDPEHDAMVTVRAEGGAAP